MIKGKDVYMLLQISNDHNSETKFLGLFSSVVEAGETMLRRLGIYVDFEPSLIDYDADETQEHTEYQSDEHIYKLIKTEVK